MRFPLFAMFGLAALALSGCVSQLSVSECPRLGVVAVLPDKVQTKRIGMWAFSNKGADADVPEAGLRKWALSRTTESLRAKGFKAEALDHPEWWPAYEKRRRSVGAYFVDNRIGDRERAALGNELKAMIANRNLDGVALILPRRPSGGGEATVGVGDYGFGTMAQGDDEVYAYSMTEILVLRGPALERKASWPVGSFKRVPGIRFQESFGAYTREEQAQIVESIKSGFGEGVDRTLSAAIKP